MKKEVLALVLAIATLVSVFAVTAVPAYAKLTPITNPKLDYQPSYPLSSYKDGSFFNDYKTDGCKDHRTSTCGFAKNCSCTHYDDSIQCMAFAKYVSDQYAHRTSWDYNDGDTTKPNKSIANDADSAKKAFYDLKIPQYAYVRADNRNNDDGHSFILISYSDSGVTMYDANYNGGCKVEYHTATYKEFAGRYKNISLVMSHKFTKTPVSVNTTYHKVACSSSGCTGYKLVKHNFTYSKKNDTYHWKTCSECGAKSTESHTIVFDGGIAKCKQCKCVLPQVASNPPISDETASVGDEIAFINNEIASVGDKITTIDDEPTTADDIGS